jgi:nucleotide-binding universal stress UspA family protein
VTLVVGLAPEGPRKAPLHLAAMLARSADEPLVLCAVVPEAWPPSAARVDAEYQAFVQGQASEALEDALERLPDDVRATTVVHAARSAPAGLLEVAEREEASLIVAGSAPSGTFGHVALGSATDRLMHSSPVPLAIATRGFRCKAGSRVTRVTAAYGVPDESEDLVVAAAGVAARVGAALRIASFAVIPRAPYTIGVGRDVQLTMAREWRESIDAAARETLARVSDLPAVPPDLESVVGYGESWDEAIEDVEWDDTDVLVVGSSAIGPIARVFLGSRASKIVRHSPVPVVVVPRAAAEELAEEAADPPAA